MTSDAVSFSAKGLLFDMDGTLIDSTLAVEGAWAMFAERFPHLDVQEILKTSHGIRTEENLHNFIPEIPLGDIPLEAQRFEEAIVLSGERNAKAGHPSFHPCAGVAENLVPVLSSSTHNWAIVTSATRVYASKALPLGGVPQPPTFVTADDVSIGKPNPAPYLKGAEGLNLPPSECIVFEDAPAGVRSGKAAGCRVIAVLTTHSRESLEAAGPDLIIKDFTQLSLHTGSNGEWVDIYKAFLILESKFGRIVQCNVP